MVRAWLGDDPDRASEVAALHPVGRIAEPHEIAEAAVWLCSERASFVVGAALSVDGGYVAQ
jgi:NAD(P)-dependent dehydrogenase (short-subunit alcohol dehydrogenase family)